MSVIAPITATSPLLGPGLTIIFASRDLADHVSDAIADTVPENATVLPDFIFAPTLTEEPETERAPAVRALFEPVILVTGPLTAQEQASTTFRRARRVWVVEERGNEAIARQVKNNDGPLMREVLAATLPDPSECLTAAEYGGLETPLEHATDDLENAAAMMRTIWQGSHRVSKHALRSQLEHIDLLLRAAAMWCDSVWEKVGTKETGEQTREESPPTP